MLSLYLINNFRYLFFFYTAFLFFFVLNSFHAITEEVCIGMCVFFFFVIVLIFLSKSGNVSLQKVWYKLFLEGFDLVNLSSVLIFKGFFFIFSSKTFRYLINFYSFYTLFFNMFAGIIYSYSVNIFSFFTTNCVGINFIFNNQSLLFRDINPIKQF